MLHSILQRHYPTYKELEVILQITEPLLYSFRVDDKKYLIYVLQSRSSITQKGVANIFEVFLGESTNENIDSLLLSNISIQDALSNTTNKQVIGMINEKIYPAKKINDLETILNRIPKQQVKLHSITMQIRQKKRNSRTK